MASDNTEKKGAIPEHTTAEQQSPPEPGELLEWRCHPVKRRPLVSVAVSFFVIIVVVTVFCATDSRAFAVLALVVMLLSLAKFYFPTSYQLTDRRVKIKTTTQTIVKPWSQYRSFYPDKNGVLLSPFPEPSRLENFRGLYLMFWNNRDEVVAFVAAHIGGEGKTSAEDPS